MKTGANIVADKFHELVHSKWTTQGRIASFTSAERAIWLMVAIRCAIDMDGFDSVFDQTLSRSELVQAIGFLKELGMEKMAELFEEALTLLSTNHFYGQDDMPVMICSELPQQYLDELDSIAERLTQEDVLYNVDEQLAIMLSRDNST